MHGGRPRTPRDPLPPGHHEPQHAPTPQTPRAQGGGRLDPRGLHKPCTRIPPGPPPRHDPQFGEASALQAAENTQLEGEGEDALSTPWIQPISPPQNTFPHHVALSQPQGPADPWGSPQSPQSLGLHSQGGTAPAPPPPGASPHPSQPWAQPGTPSIAGGQWHPVGLQQPALAPHVTQLRQPGDTPRAVSGGAAPGTPPTTAPLQRTAPPPRATQPWGQPPVPHRAWGWRGKGPGTPHTCARRKRHSSGKHSHTSRRPAPSQIRTHHRSTRPPGWRRPSAQTSRLCQG